MEKTHIGFSPLMKRWDGFYTEKWGCYLALRLEMWGKRWELPLQCKAHLGSSLVKPSMINQPAFRRKNERKMEEMGKSWKIYDGFGVWMDGNLMGGFETKWWVCCLPERHVSGTCWLLSPLHDPRPAKMDMNHRSTEIPALWPVCVDQHHSFGGPHPII